MDWREAIRKYDYRKEWSQIFQVFLRLGFSWFSFNVLCNLRVTVVENSGKKAKISDPKIKDKISSILLWIVCLEVENLCHNLHIGQVVLFRRINKTKAVIWDDGFAVFPRVAHEEAWFWLRLGFPPTFWCNRGRHMLAVSNQIKTRIENNHYQECFCSLF